MRLPWPGLGRVARALLCAAVFLSPPVFVPPAFAQDAPPLDAEPPLAPRPKAASPVQPPARKPSPVQPAAAKPAAAGPRGPAVKNDGKRYLRSLDENHDARISREEFLAGTKKRFAKLDANGDGVISAQEARAAQVKVQERKARAEARRLAQGKPVKLRPAGGKGGKPTRPSLSAVDANQDGRVSRKEFLARREKKFAELDLNRDGVVSKDESRAAKAKLLARREGRKAEARERKARKQAAAAQAPVSPPAASPLPAAPSGPPAEP